MAERKRKPLAETQMKYEEHLSAALKRPPKTCANCNVLTKAAGYFTSKLVREKKSYFLDSVEKYRSGLQPLSAPLSVLKSWIIRFKEDYLEQQTFFEPFPEKLRVIKRKTRKRKKTTGNNFS